MFSSETDQLSRLAVSVLFACYFTALESLSFYFSIIKALALTFWNCKRHELCYLDCHCCILRICSIILKIVSKCLSVACSKYNSKNVWVFFFFFLGFFVLFVELRYIWLTTCTLNMLIASKVIVTFGLFVNWFKDEKHVMLGVIAGINNVKTFS